VGICKDPVLTYLNSSGYNVVRLPRAGIEPLDVLGRDGKSLEKLGSIAEVWTSSNPAPQPGAPMPVAGLNGKTTADLDIGVGLKLLAGALSGLGAAVGLPTLGLAYKDAKSVQFTIQNAASVSISEFAIGKFLSAGRLDLTNPFVVGYFGNEETQEYILMDVLKANSISVTAKDDSGTEIKLDIPALQNVVGANVNVKVGTSSQREIVYEGSTQITFGFKAFEALFEDGTWKVRGAAATAGLAYGAAASGGSGAATPVGAGAGILLGPSGFTRI
jgi:hypothetical protein